MRASTVDEDEDNLINEPTGRFGACERETGQIGRRRHSAKVRLVSELDEDTMLTLQRYDIQYQLKLNKNRNIKHT